MRYKNSLSYPPLAEATRFAPNQASPRRARTGASFAENDMPPKKVTKKQITKKPPKKTGDSQLTPTVPPRTSFCPRDRQCRLYCNVPGLRTFDLSVETAQELPANVRNDPIVRVGSIGLELWEHVAQEGAPHGLRKQRRSLIVLDSNLYGPEILNQADWTASLREHIWVDVLRYITTLKQTFNGRDYVHKHWVLVWAKVQDSTGATKIVYYDYTPYNSGMGYIKFDRVLNGTAQENHRDMPRAHEQYGHQNYSAANPRQSIAQGASRTGSSHYPGPSNSPSPYSPPDLPYPLGVSSLSRTSNVFESSSSSGTNGPRSQRSASSMLLKASPHPTRPSTPVQMSPNAMSSPLSRRNSGQIMMSNTYQSSSIPRLPPSPPSLPTPGAIIEIWERIDLTYHLPLPIQTFAVRDPIAVLLISQRTEFSIAYPPGSHWLTIRKLLKPNLEDHPNVPQRFIRVCSIKYDPVTDLHLKFYEEYFADILTGSLYQFRRDKIKCRQERFKSVPPIPTMPQAFLLPISDLVG